MTSTTTDINLAVATKDDLTDICVAFKAMLHDLAPFGHDVLPTRRNTAFFGSHIFGPALETGDHGIIVIRDDDGKLIGCTFFVPDNSPLEIDPGRAVAHGIYVHPAHRKQGLALLMQDEAHKRLVSLGYTSLVSVVMRDNQAGMASARKAGAVITGYTTSVSLKGAE